MPFDERLADRIRALTGDRSDIAERKMFGGLAFLLRGHMCCGIVGAGMVYVAPAGVRTAGALRKWIERGIRFAETLPAHRD
jgi:hypothetical protein